MGFRHACFISYRHVHEPKNIARIEQFVGELRSYIENEIDGIAPQDAVFFDRDIEGGDLWNQKINKAVCYSAVMVVIFTANYFSTHKTFCAREYWAMEKLEKNRHKPFENIDHGLIIPVIFNGIDKLPAAVSSERQYLDFTGCITEFRDLSTDIEYQTKFAKMAQYISKVYQHLNHIKPDLCVDCDLHQIPEPDEPNFKIWLQHITTSPELPFRAEE